MTVTTIASSQWSPDDTYATEGYVAEVDEGWLYVWVGPPLVRDGDRCWYYGVEIGHMDGGSRLDPPEWCIDDEVTNVACASKADGQFRALRHYDRMMVRQQTCVDEENEWLARNPEDPDPHWWKAG